MRLRAEMKHGDKEENPAKAKASGKKGSAKESAAKGGGVKEGRAKEASAKGSESKAPILKHRDRRRHRSK